MDEEAAREEASHAPGLRPPAARLSVLGPLVIDRIFHVDALPGHDEKAFATASSTVPGGPPTHVATALAGWGFPVRLVSAIGDDASGDLIVAEFARRGIATGDIVRLAGGRTMNTIIILDRTGEKAAIIEPTPEDVLAAIGATATFTEGESVLANLYHPDGVHAVFTRARAVSALTLLDLELPEIGRWGWPAARRVVDKADLVVSNAQVVASLGEPTVAGARRLAAELSAGRRAACVTLGAEGVVTAEGGRFFHVAADVVTAVNTTGAGDTFLAALAIGLADGSPLARAAATASIAAARHIAGRQVDWADAVAAGAMLQVTPLEADP
jgi:sugar/nucleoside kinase (ribokinase family)